MQRVRRWWKQGTSFWDGWVIVGLAAWLRLLSLPDPFFITDQGRALLAGRNILLGEWVSWGPPTSVSGLSLGPFYYYWSAAALWLSSFQVWGPTLSVAVANIVGVFLVWAWLRRYWGRLAAVTGGGVLAVSSLAALQAQIALEPAPLPLFAALWLWLITKIVLSPPAIRRTWWIWLWLTLSLAVQLNASAVILMAVSLSVWWFSGSKPKWMAPLWRSGVGVVALLTLFKIAWRGSTPAEFWWHTWIHFISPDQPLVAWAWLLLVILGGSAWLQRRRFPLSVSQQQQPLVWILGAWASWSLLAFSVKTVSGDHALAIVFVLIALVLGIVVHMNVPRGHSRMALGAVLMFLVLRSLFTYQWLVQHTHPRVSDHLPLVQAISDLSRREPYALRYRGHLDVYDAADDHLQYLLWLDGNPPAIAARVEFTPDNLEYCEDWLLSSPSHPLRMLTLYTPPEVRANFSDSDTVAYESDAGLLTVGTAPSFLCR